VYKVEGATEVPYACFQAVIGVRGERLCDIHLPESKASSTKWQSLIPRNASGGRAIPLP